MNLILASASPRRQELIARISPRAVVCATNIDETVPEGLSPEKMVEYLARKKALAVASLTTDPEAWVVGADTAVYLGDHIFGKPADAAMAFEMLSALSGKTHNVCTGVAITAPDGETTVFSETTQVTFYKLSPAEINAYIAMGEPMDKAGAYGIQGQGAMLVKSICGDYYNVVGLPIARLARKLGKLMTLNAAHTHV